MMYHFKKLARSENFDHKIVRASLGPYWPFILIILLLTACGPSAERLLAEGNRAFAADDYAEAVEIYRQAGQADPELTEPIYNLGNTHYRQEDYAEAHYQHFRAAQTAEGELAQSTHYNLGNTYFQIQDWPAAIEAYQAALRLNPADQDAKYNLELALRNQKAAQSQESQQNQTSQEGDEGQNHEQSSQEQDEQGQEQQFPAGQDDAGEAEATPQPQAEGPGEAQTAETGGESQGQEGMSLEQALQLLTAIGQQTKTLQEQLQQIYVAPGELPEKDW